MTTVTESTNKRLDTIIYLLLKAQSPQKRFPGREIIKELHEQGLDLDVIKYHDGHDRFVSRMG